MAEFREALQRGRLTADGAMGTLLMGRGPFRGRSLDELNLSLPALVRDVHRDYLRAGAQIIGTNTFGANRYRLGAFGLGNQAPRINQAGARIARESVRASGEASQAFVAGVVGPLGVNLEPLGRATPAEARDAFAEQIGALLESGVDLLALETFRDLAELREAVSAAREAAGPEMVIVAQATAEDGGKLMCGLPPQEFMRRLEDLPVDVVGVNCSSGPAAALEALEAMAPYSARPLCAMPSAGLPKSVHGRLEYSCSPEYMAGYTAQFVLAGARIVGGCCGTAPAHIREIRASMQGDFDTRRASAVFIPERQTDLPKLDVRERSRLGAKLAAAEFAAIFEIHAPRSGDVSPEVAAAREAKQRGADCIVVPEARSSGRMGALALCSLVQQQAGIECVLPLAGPGPDIRGFESALLSAYSLGIRNLLLPPELVGLPEMFRQTSFVVGVTVNPGAADVEEEIRQLERKLEAGADFALAEPVFNAERLEAFLDRVRPHRIPVIVRIAPLRDFRDAEFFNNEMGAGVAPEYMARMSAAGDGEAARVEGLAIARELAKRARRLAAGVVWSGPAGGYEGALDVEEGATLVP